MDYLVWKLAISVHTSLSFYTYVVLYLSSHTSALISSTLSLLYNLLFFYWVTCACSTIGFTLRGSFPLFLSHIHVSPKEKCITRGKSRIDTEGHLTLRQPPRQLVQGIPKHFALQFLSEGKSLQRQASFWQKQVNWNWTRKEKLAVQLPTPKSFIHGVPKDTLCHHSIF